MSLSRLSLVLAFASTAMFTGCNRRESPPTEPAPGTDTSPHAMGLKPMTDEERARLKQIAPELTTVVPNELARERLNAERKARGLPPLPAEPVSPPPPPAKK